MLSRPGPCLIKPGLQPRNLGPQHRSKSGTSSPDNLGVRLIWGALFWYGGDLIDRVPLFYTGPAFPETQFDPLEAPVNFPDTYRAR